MIHIDKQLCYSPEPPENYAWWKNDIPDGPIVCVVDRATGNKLIKSRNKETKDLVAGLPPWNLFYLLYPEVDRLPDVIRKWQTPEILRTLMSYPRPSVDDYLTLYEFAESAYEWLLLPPIQFMEKVRKTGLGLPLGKNFVTVLKRAKMIDDIAPMLIGNVVWGSFGKKRAV